MEKQIKPSTDEGSVCYGSSDGRPAPIKYASSPAVEHDDFGSIATTFMLSTIILQSLDSKWVVFQSEWCSRPAAPGQIVSNQVYEQATHREANTPTPSRSPISRKPSLERGPAGFMNTSSHSPPTSHGKDLYTTAPVRAEGLMLTMSGHSQGPLSKPSWAFDQGISSGKSDYIHQFPITTRLNPASGSTTNGEHELSISGSSQESNATTYNHPVAYENSRNFPPRLPTAPPFESNHTRASALKNIKHFFLDSEHVVESESPRSGYASTGSASSRYDDLSPSAYSVASSDSWAGKLTAMWREVNEARQRLRETKNKYANRRAIFKESRDKLNDADNRFMNSLRPTLLNQGKPFDLLGDTLASQFSELQRLRSEYQHLESSCEELEDLVDRQDAYIHFLEVRFYSVLSTGNDVNDVNDGNSASASDGLDSAGVPEDLRGISPDGPVEEMHPLYVQLQLAVADMRVEQEELANLRSMKERYDEALRFWNMKKESDNAITSVEKAPLQVPRNVREFLDDFPSREADKTEEVNLQTREVSRLKLLCEKKDLMPKHLSQEMSLYLYPDSVFDDISLESNRPAQTARSATPLAHHRFSELLSQPDYLLEKPMPLTLDEATQLARELPDNDPTKRLKMQQTRRERDIDDLNRERTPNNGGTAEFVNRWLLYTLRTSPINVLMLYKTFLQKLRVNNVLRWQYDVLRYWFEDDAGDDADLYRRLVCDNSEYLVQHGTLPRSRGASDGGYSDAPRRLRRRTHSNSLIAVTAV